MSKNKNELSTQSKDETPELAILKKMTRLIGIQTRLGLETVKSNRTQGELILLLDSVGCGPSETASLLGTTSNTVNVTLSKAKREKRKK
jgi:DNA-directed RNA polymerase specialized sigma24 family protein